MHRRGLTILTIVLQLGGCAGLLGDRATLYEQMDDQDISLAASKLQQSLETAPDGATRHWSNNATGRRGAITPTRTYLNAGGHFCRDYIEDLSSGEQSGRFYNTACRDQDVGWFWL